LLYFAGKEFDPFDRWLALVDGACSEVEKAKYLSHSFFCRRNIKIREIKSFESGLKTS
jgi:hypothetical protein